jgi:pantoate--beta-alanine ligase
MQTVITIPELRSAHASLAEPVGFVPTMGYLHEGHLSLVRRARAECASVAVSIFVNPTQFGPNEDLSTYPCDLTRDLGLLEAEKVDLVWMPTPDAMYPPDFQTWVTVEEVAQPLDGRLRPGHFRGVTTIVTKLFNGVQPQTAYFGQKDAQQAIVIQQMTRDLNLPIDIVICPIIREPDGLAMSSRNTYLNPKERQAATALYRGLSAANAAFEAGERNAGRLCDVVTETIASEPLARLQYVSCAHPDTLQELGTVADGALISLAAFVGQTRLIDNIVIKTD